MSFFEDDWRSQLDSKYDEFGKGGDGLDDEDDFTDLAGGGSGFNRFKATGNNTMSDALYEADYLDQLQAQNVVFDSIRFPPLVKKGLPALLQLDEFKIPPSLVPYDAKRASLRSNDSIAGLDFLEAMYQTLSEKAIDSRSSLLEQGTYIYSLPNPPDAEDSEYVRNTIMDNLLLLRDESVYLIKEMAIFHSDKINDMVHEDSVAAKDAIVVRKAKLLDYASLLKTEIAESAIVVDHLIQYANSLINYPTHAICPLDGVFIDWTKMAKMQHQSYMSTKAANYVAHMHRNGLPVCDSVFAFLQSSQKCANILSFRKYTFELGELKEIFRFFRFQHEKIVRKHEGDNNINTPRTISSILETIKEMNFVECDVGNKDCHLIADMLPDMPSLEIVNLSRNRIGDQGVASLCIKLWESKSRLRVLNLNNNEITAEGMSIISEALPRLQLLDYLSLNNNPIGNIGVYHVLKSLMNPFRKAYISLPSISTVGGLGVDGDDDGNDEYANTAPQVGERAVIRGSGVFEGADDVSVSVIMGGGGGGGGGGGSSKSVVSFLNTSFNSDRGDGATAASRRHSLSHPKHRKPYPKCCYFKDYFESIKPKRKARKKSKYSDKFVDSEGNEIDLRNENRNESSDEESVEDWINDEEDEFLMDVKSDYGDDHPPPSLAAVAKSAAKPVGGGEEDNNGDVDDINQGKHNIPRSSVATIVGAGTAAEQEALRKRLSAAGITTEQQSGSRVSVMRKQRGEHDEDEEEEEHQLLVAKFKNVIDDEVALKPVPKFVQILIKHRIKFAAMAMFLKVSHRGSLLSSLYVRGCGLDSRILPVLRHVLDDNANLCTLDLSDNAKVLSRQESCKLMSKIMLGSELSTVKLNNCGISDKGLSELTKSSVKNKELVTLELSRNFIGPTGANWLASMNNVYTFDSLSLGGTFHRSAPFFKYGDEEHDANLDDTDDDPDNYPASEDDWDYGYDSADEYEPFEDTDLYDGDEDYDEDDEEEEDENEEGGDGTYYGERKSGEGGNRRSDENDDDDDDDEEDDDEDEDEDDEEEAEEEDDDDDDGSMQ